jgi:hypothetical protein
LRAAASDVLARPLAVLMRLWRRWCLFAAAASLRKTTKQVLTSRHAGCTFTVHRKQTGAIPKAEGQQNADGSGVKPGLVGVQLCREPFPQGYLLRSLQQTQGFLTTDDVYRQQAS